MQAIGKGALRVAKNYTKGYSDVQAKVRDATSNDPWGPSGTQMNEIAQLTYNQNDFVEIMEMLDKRLNDKGKNWRHVFKALTLLDYCLHAGSENVVIYFRDNVYLVKTLKEFQFIDEYGKDQGANVRQKAKDITNLLQDESRLRQERRSRANMRDRMKGGGGGDDERDRNSLDENAARRKQSQPQPQPSTSRRNKDDDELKKAMEESRKTFEKETGQSTEDADLKRALELSEKEENDRQRAVEDANQKSLFDDGLQTNQAPTTNPFPLVDAGLQPQYTMQPQYTVQPQFTSFNPYHQAQQDQMQLQWQQMQQAQLQQEQLAQQQAWELQQQQLAQQQLAQQQAWELQQQQQQLAQQQFLQQQQQQQQWLMQQQQQQLVPQPTGFGSRNPFALGQTSSSPAPPVPSLQIPNGGQQQQQQFQPAPAPSPIPSSASTSTGPPQVKTRTDENPQLAALFANRDGGIDTFGNYGNLRFGSSHAGKLLATNTGAPAANHAQNDQPFFSV